MMAMMVLRVLLAVLTVPLLVNCQFNDTLTKWIKTENVTALGRIFANIGPLGQYANDGDPGAVVAAPSTDNPDYYYQITSLPIDNRLTYTGSEILR